MGVLVLGSCAKDAVVTSTTPKKDLITGGSSKSWVASKFEISTGGVTQNVTSTVSSCDFDNIYTYKTDGTMTEDEGPTKCSASGPQSLTGSYSFNANETVLTQVSGGVSDVYNVVEITSTKIAISQSTSTGGVTYVTTATFVPK
jgi:hypothetical protein